MRITYVNNNERGMKMKKVKYLFMIIAVSVLLTGCVKFNASMDIKKDKSMDFSVIYAFDKTVFGDQMSLKEEDMDDVKKQGFTVTKYSEGNFEGFKISQKINNIDEVSTENDVEYDLSGMMEESENNKYIFKVVKGTDKNTYYAKLKFDSKDSGLNNTESGFDDEDLADENDTLTTGDNSLDNVDLNALMNSLDLKFNVKLPNAALSSNATEKSSDNKNLTWKLGTEKTEYVEYAFELENNSGNNILNVIIWIAVVLIVTFAALIISKNITKSRMSKTNSVNSSDNTNQPVKE